MTSTEDLEISLLLEGIHERYGFDFRQYAPVSLKRRIRHVVREEGLKTVSGLQERVLHQTEAMERLLLALSIHVTSMFRDPAFYRAFRSEVAPALRPLNSFRVWHAGCSTGEEVYSMAILLEEEGVYGKCRVYATDLSEVVLEKAREGILPLAHMRDYSANYQAGGGLRSFGEYYTARYDHAILHADLRRNILFAPHNLVSDASFNEFQVVVCRNVLIYFNRSLQERVHRLFYESLPPAGVLALGLRESLALTPHEADYQALDAEAKIYRKVR